LPCRGIQQHTAKTQPRQEIGIGDDDLVLCMADGAQIGMLDIAAMAQVVAYQQRDSF
jgi:hypothetical protein